MEKHLQIITCGLADLRTRKILTFFYNKAKDRGLAVQFFYEPIRNKVFFILYADRIFNIGLNLKVVKAREQLKEGGNQ